jgi:hypothetical protein
LEILRNRNFSHGASWWSSRFVTKCCTIREKEPTAYSKGILEGETTRDDFLISQSSKKMGESKAYSTLDNCEENGWLVNIELSSLH